MMNRKKLISAIAIFAVLAMWAVALAPSAATHEVASDDTFADSVDYATGAAVAQYRGIEDFIHYE